ncbi:MAG: FCD domain-containing protein [Streptosporangiales bacterium]|nr:FCD domain-containing protein [Streptosporangiales bacterium]
MGGVNETPFLAVRPHTTHAHVVDQLGLRILAGEVTPGVALPTEAVLAGQLGVSRGALREAVKALVAKGLLEVRPRTGTRVRPRDAWNFLDRDVLRWQREADEQRLLRNLTELRHAVEPEAARLAADRATDAELDELRRTYATMESAAESGDMPTFNEADVAFHRTLLRAADNDLFGSLEQAIEVSLRDSFTTLSAKPGAPDATLPLHRAVLDAVLARDGELAAAAAYRVVFGARDARW